MSSPLRDESRALRDRYDEEPTHSDHVADLALRLFDALQPWHRLEPRLRQLLDSAALLHDIGWSQTPGGRGHHKESARLIQTQSWQHLSPAEIALVAQIARYHRKVIPQPGHQEFHALPPAAQKQILILGGILRLADALDRSHTGRITGLDAVITEAALLIRVQSSGDWEAERAMFETKRDLLELAAHRAVKCEALKPAAS